MTDLITIKVKNRLNNAKEKIEVYHHYTKIADAVGYNQSITLPLKTFTTEGKKDYLQISPVNESGDLMNNCMMNLPSWADFEFFSKKSVGIAIVHSGDRTLLKISTAPPTWELRISRPTEAGVQKDDHLTICNE